MKKKIQLQHKKLSFKKDTIAALSNDVMQQINGGDQAPTRTLQSRQVDAGCTGTIFVNTPVILPTPPVAVPPVTPGISIISNG